MKRLLLGLAALALTALPGCVLDVGCRGRGHRRDHRPHFRADAPAPQSPSERK
jgi:hypothetical protein